MTDKTNNGGPAFPVSAPDENYLAMHQIGMSLRDWFAGQALAGTLGGGNLGVNTTYEDVAKVCYRQADAMIAERAT